MWWNKEKIYYYINAAEKSSFHENLASVIKPHIKENKIILDAGCGLGYLAAILKEEGYEIKAIDSDERVIKEAERIHKKPIFSVADAFKLTDVYETIILSFFGNIRENLDYFLSHVSENLIYITSAHIGVVSDFRKDKSCNIDMFLASRNMKFKKEEYEFNFDQVLKSIDEAYDFMSITYSSSNISKLEKNEDEEFPFVIRNRKKIYVYVIEKEERT